MKTIRGRVCGALFMFCSGLSFAQDNFINDDFLPVISDDMSVVTDTENCSADDSIYDDESGSFHRYPGGSSHSGCSGHHGRPYPGYPGSSYPSYPNPSYPSYPGYPSYPRPGANRDFECVARSRGAHFSFRGEGFTRFMAERTALQNCRFSSPYAHSCYIAYCTSMGGRGGHF